MERPAFLMIAIILLRFLVRMANAKSARITHIQNLFLMTILKARNAFQTPVKATRLCKSMENARLVQFTHTQMTSKGIAFKMHLTLRKTSSFQQEKPKLVQFILTQNPQVSMILAQSVSQILVTSMRFSSSQANARNVQFIRDQMRIGYLASLMTVQSQGFFKSMESAINPSNLSLKSLSQDQIW